LSDIVICGYYGFKNSGDDALLLSIIQQIKKYKNDIDITVLSKNPEETERIYGVGAVKRDAIFAVLKSLFSCKLLVLGGGTLIQDRTSTKSLIYYLLIICIALVFRKKVMLYSNGIGPVKEKNVRLTRKILNRVNLITLRDKQSAYELEKMGINKPKIVITADSAFCLESKSGADIAEFKKKHNIPTDKKYVCIAVREHKKLCSDFCENIANMCDYILKKYDCIPVFIPFQAEKDSEITKRIMEMMKEKSLVADVSYSILELVEFMSSAELCVGMRLHSLIYSTISQTPLIGLSYDPKVSGFMEYLGQKQCLDAEKLDYDELINCVDYYLCLADEIEKEIKESCVKMRALAEENAKLLAELIK